MVMVVNVESEVIQGTMRCVAVPSMHTQHSCTLLTLLLLAVTMMMVAVAVTVVESLVL